MTKQVKVNKNKFVMDAMSDMAGKPMSAVVEYIATELAIPAGRARAYYSWAVKNGAPGTVERTARAAKPKAERKPKLVKARTDRSFLLDSKPVTDKTVEELADLKARNLARLKAIGQKYAPAKKVVNGATISADEEQLPSFASPAFLTAEDVKALI
jgi:hypothetical protein